MRIGVATTLAATLALLVGTGALVPHGRAQTPGRKIPPAPYYYVLDEPHVIPPRNLHALEKVLIEHDRATGEQVLVAVFKDLGGDDPVAFTNKVFSTWGIGKRGKDNGVLLALYWTEHKARIEVGYGLEATLTDAKSSDVLHDTLIPELKNNDPGRGLSLAVFQILTTLNSPLVENGEAQRILRGGGFSGAWQARPPNSGFAGGWGPWVFLGFVLLFIVLNMLTAADAHFTSAGWYRPSPLTRRRWGSSGGISGGGLGGGGLFGGGWGGGGWGGGGGGGGGGFMGGGGSSGGGGASGSW